MQAGHVIQEVFGDVPSGERLGAIGPNAIIQIAAALRQEYGWAAVESIFTAAGLSRYLKEMPQEMVAETEVVSLHQSLQKQLGIDAARRISWQAGMRTGDYLLAHRIPKPAQFALRFLPSSLSSRILLHAIARNAWTFAGSGTFRYRAGRPVIISISGGLLSRGMHAFEPICDFYSATFATLFRTLVDSATEVREKARPSPSSDDCVFELRW